VGEDRVRFEVARAFPLSGRQLFVLSGRVLRGEIHAGMHALIRCNPQFALDAKIHGVEYVDGPGDKSEVALTVRCADDDELDFWSGLNIGDEIVEVVYDVERVGSNDG
jgi:hypothetical protein